MPCNREALIAVENCSYGFDGLFSYLIPENFNEKVKPGVRVLVPFGRGNVNRQGFVFYVNDNLQGGEALKSIAEVLDDSPVLSAELIRLAEWLKDTCFCTYFNAAKALLPGGMCLYTEKTYFALPDKCVSELNEDEKRVYEYLLLQKNPERESTVLKKCCLAKDSGVFATLEANGFVEAKKSAFSKIKELTVKSVRLSDENIDFESSKITPKQKKIIEFLLKNGEKSIKEVCYFTGVTPAVIKRLVDSGICEAFEEKVSREPYFAKKDGVQKNVLSKSQRDVFEKLYAAYKSPTSKTALLFGVTGSGKTSVYLELIDNVLKDGKTALVLVPEISLTPQALSLFKSRYGEKTAVLHSGLSDGERFDEFNRIKDGSASVVIGTRSAIFAPLENIGAIIIDEEQEHTYKSEMSPRYNAKDVAKFRASVHNALLVFASATPSVETYAKAVSGKYILCELPQRFGNAVLPEVKTVDMTDKSVISSFSAISEPLTREIQKNIDAGEQSILLINRRGYNTFVVCNACKKVMTCPKCSISLTYHSANNRLMCHYCGYSSDYKDSCPVCGDKNIRYAGFGTQRIEQELKVKFPSARILRMDADTTTAKNAHDKAFSAFSKGDYDIMLGTQMVAKGLDFPNVTLVGVTSADNELYNDDFRCSERSFDLLTQVVGRAGRGEKNGRAVIQTVAPDNNILSLAAKQNYKTFFEQEMIIRKAMIYPPFCDICVIGIASGSEALAFDTAKTFFELLKNEAENNPEMHIIVLGPVSPRISKLNDSFRQRIIIKCKNSSDFRNMISRLLKNIMSEKKYKNVTIFADINPENTDI